MKKATYAQGTMSDVIQRAGLDEKPIPDGHVVLTFTRVQWTAFMHIIDALPLQEAQQEIYRILNQIGESYE